MNVTRFYERYWQNPAAVDSDIGLAVEPRKALLRAALRDLPLGAPVLDAGCGEGMFSAFMISLGFSVTGVDVAANALARAQRLCQAATFQTAALEAGLPFKSGMFAAVWCSEVLEHLFDVHIALAELNRVLRPGGILVLTTPYHGTVKNVIITFKGFDTHYNPYLSHIRFFSRRSLIGCLERAGFEIVHWGGIGRVWPIWKSQVVVCRKVGEPGPSPEIVG